MISLIRHSKRARLALLLCVAIIPVLALSGCAPATPSHPITSTSHGFFNHYFVYTFSNLIKYFGNAFHGDYGLSIIVMTFFIRVAILPLMMNQTKKQFAMREKMAVLQPELNALKEKYKKDKSADARGKQQAEMMQLYQKHQVNPLNIGCLPMLIQWPITLGFYYAIRRTPEIAAHNFLWFSLGKPDVVLPFIAAAVYFIQFRVSQKMTASYQQNANPQLAVIGYIPPIMMGIFAFAMPAALPLYWAVGGIFIIVQTVLLNKWYRKPVQEEKKDQPVLAK